MISHGRRFGIVLFVTASCLAYSTSASAQVSAEENYHLKVALEVSANENFRDELSSCIASKLRAFGDVDIVDNDDLQGFSEIHVIAVQAGDLYVLTFMALGVPDSTLMWLWYSDKVPRNKYRYSTTEAPYRKPSVRDYEIVTRLSIQAGCEAVVSGLNAGVFETDRKTMLRAKEYMEKGKK